MMQARQGWEAALNFFPHPPQWEYGAFCLAWGWGMGDGTPSAKAGWGKTRRANLRDPVAREGQISGVKERRGREQGRRCSPTRPRGGGMSICLTPSIDWGDSPASLMPFPGSG